MNELKQMADHITNNMVSHALNELYWDYAEQEQDFDTFMCDYVKPALDEASDRFVSHKENPVIQYETQVKLDAIMDSLQEWCKLRNLTTTQQNHDLLGNVLEELTELARAKTDNERIEALCNIVVYTISAYDAKFYYGECIGYDVRNEDKLLNFISVVTQSIQCVSHIYIVYMCFGSMRQLGYDPFECMNQTIKEIISNSEKWNKKLGQFVKDAGIYITPLKQSQTLRVKYAPHTLTIM